MFKLQKALNFQEQGYCKKLVRLKNMKVARRTQNCKDTNGIAKNIKTAGIWWLQYYRDCRNLEAT